MTVLKNQIQTSKNLDDGIFVIHTYLLLIFFTLFTYQNKGAVSSKLVF